MMEMQFNIEEILEIAEQIERNGTRYYRRAAELTALHDHKKLLLELADMEARHEKIFARMKAQLAEKQLSAGFSDLDRSAVQYLQAFADGNIFDINTDPSTQLSGKQKAEDILRFAIGLEKDSIIFYYGIQEMISPELGRDQINDIIKEEMSHITFLNTKLKAL